MVPTNAELVRSIYAAWERGDFTSDEWLDPDVEYVIADGPSPGSWKGADAMWRNFREVLSAWEGFRGEVDEIRELDDERVLVLVHYRGRGRASGVDVDRMGARGANLFHLRDGRATRFVLYFDREHALADLGLS